MLFLYGKIHVNLNINHSRAYFCVLKKCVWRGTLIALKDLQNLDQAACEEQCVPNLSSWEEVIEMAFGRKKKLLRCTELAGKAEEHVERPRVGAAFWEQVKSVFSEFGAES